MSHAEYIKQLIEKDGGVTVSVTFLDSAGGTSLKTNDEIATDVILDKGIIAYGSIDEGRPHVQEVDDITRDADEVVITCNNKLLTFGPLWLPEQVVAAQTWHKSAEAAIFKSQVRELFDEVSG